MSSISTLDDSAHLGVPNTCLLSCGAYTTRADTYFDDVSTTQYQLLNHLTSHYVSSEDSLFREVLSHFFHVLYKVFRVTVSNIDTDECNLRYLIDDGAHFIVVFIAGTAA